jgi:hypothetical protein
MATFMRNLATNQVADARTLGGEPAESYARPFTSPLVTAGAAAAETFDATNFTKRVIDAPEITEEVIANGSVSVYMSFADRTFQLPYTVHVGGKPSTLDYYLVPGEIHITRFSHDNSGTASISPLLRYRYVVIPDAEVLALAGTPGDNAGDPTDSSTG